MVRDSYCRGANEIKETLLLESCLPNMPFFVDVSLLCYSPQQAKKYALKNRPGQDFFLIFFWSHPLIQFFILPLLMNSHFVCTSSWVSSLSSGNAASVPCDGFNQSRMHQYKIAHNILICCYCFQYCSLFYSLFLTFHCSSITCLAKP